MARPDPDSLLRMLYAKSAVAKAMLDHFAERQKNASETTVESMIATLERQGLPVSRATVVEIFRDLDAAGAGRFLVGRKQHPSRFVWSEESCSVGRRARNGGASDAGESAPAPAVVNRVKPPPGFVDHPFLLRPGVQISVSLPPDLTQTEATRIAEFIKTLPFDR
jgi:hypothetical protein